MPFLTEKQFNMDRVQVGEHVSFTHSLRFFSFTTEAGPQPNISLHNDIEVTVFANTLFKGQERPG